MRFIRLFDIATKRTAEMFYFKFLSDDESLKAALRSEYANITADDLTGTGSLDSFSISLF